MTIRKQPRSEKHPYASPTTPGLYVTFRDYIIELVCINTNNKVGPRFWSDNHYWGPKYKREIKGMANISKALNLTDPIVKNALIQIIKEYNIKALVANKTIDRIIRLTNKRVLSLLEHRHLLAKNDVQTEVDEYKNSTFVDTGMKNKLAKIREIENG